MRTGDRLMEEGGGEKKKGKFIDQANKRRQENVIELVPFYVRPDESLFVYERKLLQLPYGVYNCLSLRLNSARESVLLSDKSFPSSFFPSLFHTRDYSFNLSISLHSCFFMITLGSFSS